MSGFYAQNRLNASEEQKTYVPTMQNFLNYIRERKAPLDFFTWACHTSNSEELMMYARYARTYLDGAGFKKTKSFLVDYNTAEGDTLPFEREGFHAELAASLITAQRASIDMMIYATSDVTSGQNGLFSVNDFRVPHRYAAFHAAGLFAKLYRLGTAAETTGDSAREIYSIAAFNKEVGGLMVVTRNFGGKVEVQLNGAEYDSCNVTKLVFGGERGRGVMYRSDNIRINKNRLILAAKKNEIYYFELKKPEVSETDDIQEFE
jgi:choline dehydrogenase-like flavoprotein